MKTTKLTPDAAQEVIAKILPTVSNVILLRSLEYVETKEFDITKLIHSTHHIFSAYNPGIDLSQKVTYNVENNSIDFTLHSMPIL